MEKTSTSNGFIQKCHLIVSDYQTDISGVSQLGRFNCFLISKQKKIIGLVCKSCHLGQVSFKIKTENNWCQFCIRQDMQWIRPSCIMVHSKYNCIFFLYFFHISDQETKRPQLDFHKWQVYMYNKIYSIK